MDRFLYDNGLRPERVKHEIQKTHFIPQKGLRKSEESSNENILPIPATLNPNYPNIFNTIKISLVGFKNNVRGFHNIKLIQSNTSPQSKKNF